MTRTAPPFILFLLVFLTMLAACSGGGSSGSGQTGDTLYTIGGTVSGLSGEIVLRNDQDLLTISADGNFTFATGLVAGSTYRVTVEIQHAGQVCLVFDGSGTVAADVTNISVQCAMDIGLVTPLYPVNGADWNDYVVDDGLSPLTATGTACQSASDTSCLHGGEMRLLTLIGYSSCTDLSARDFIDAFEWVCDDSLGTVRIISTGLKDSSGLADLIDFSVPGWAGNHVMVYSALELVAISTSEAWWSNAFAQDIQATANGTIYVISEDLDLTGTGTGLAVGWGTDKVALVAAPGVLVSGRGGGAGASVMHASLNNFIWLEGMTIDATGSDYGIYWNAVKFSVMRNLAAHSADTSAISNGIQFDGGSNLRLSGLAVSGNAQDGIRASFANSEARNITSSDNNNSGIRLSGSGNTLDNIAATGNTTGIYISSSTGNELSAVATDGNSTGVVLFQSANNLITDIVSAHESAGLSLQQSSDGNLIGNADLHRSGFSLINSSANIVTDISAGTITIQNSSNDNTLSGIVVSNGGGISLSGVYDNILANVTLTSSKGAGLRVAGSSNNILTALTVTNNGGDGVWIDSSSNNTLSQAVVSNNDQRGMRMALSESNTLSSLVFAAQGTEIDLFNCVNNYFTGPLKMWSSSCLVSGGTNPGLDHGTCANNGVSDSTLTTGVTTLSSFTGKVTTDDGQNSSDINGAAILTDMAAPFDWVNFTNAYRTWGQEGDSHIQAGSGHVGCSDYITATQTECESLGETWLGNARIWDWTMVQPDSVLRDTLSMPSSGNEVLNHTWSDLSAVTFLRNAMEIAGDGIGNDNYLCESGETCLYLPNIGSYQGHGNIISAGSIGTGGVLENITLLKYETNGY